MAKSNRGPKPAKPYPDCPLFAHASGRFAKKIRGKFKYFGKWEDGWQAAIDLYREQADDLHAGRTPRPASGELTVRTLVNHFLTSKQLTVGSGELSERSFHDYFRICEKLVDDMGHRPVDDLLPGDFEAFRAKLAKRLGPAALGIDITRIKSVFRYGFESMLFDQQIRFGPTFKQPGKRAIRKARAGNGQRMFEAHELKMLLADATPLWRAFVLLAMNCGFGQSDIATLPRRLAQTAVETGWLSYPRPKTGVDRRCPLWPETSHALDAALDQPRPKARKVADGDLAFLAKDGRRWVRLSTTGTGDDELGREFTGWLTRLGIKRKGVAFYAIRHTFETIAGASLDQPAIDLIMGHSDQSMAAVYRERIDDSRLEAVTEHVRAWVFGE